QCAAGGRRARRDRLGRGGGHDRRRRHHPYCVPRPRAGPGAGPPDRGNAGLMTGKLRTAVLGATGYSGLELTRILLRHPRLEKPVLLRRSADNGSAADLADVFPALSGNGGYPLHALSWSALKQQGVQLLFLATPHEVSRSLVPEARAQGLRVIDLSGAWRLKQEQHRAIYSFEDSDAVSAA